MTTIRLSFMEGIDCQNNTNAKFRSLFACLSYPPGNLPAHVGRGMESGGPTDVTGSRAAGFLDGSI
jgi:hypothetical protein